MTSPATTSASLARVRALSRVLDTAIHIPGTSLRFGLDALIGLVPGVGDVVGAGMSGFIILTAARLGAPAPVLLRMLVNVGIDTIVGAVPLLGDIFDAAWRANTRNTALLERHLAAPAATRRASGAVVAAVAVALILLVAGTIVLAGWLLGVLVSAAT